MTKSINCFYLDDATIEFEPGETIMQAAHRADHYIPHLCYHPRLSQHGSCRLCMVEINGSLVAACSYPAQNGQRVFSDNSEINSKRLQLVQMLFAEGNHYCPSCEVSGNCQLQALAYDLGMTHYNLEPLYPKREQDASHPQLFIDQDRCIYCELCSRASQQLDNKDCFGIGGRGSTTHLILKSDSGSAVDTALAETDKAAHICPVGCILPRTGNYQDAVGKRLYDEKTIHELGNHRADESRGKQHD